MDPAPVCSTDNENNNNLVEQAFPQVKQVERQVKAICSVFKPLSFMGRKPKHDDDDGRGSSNVKGNANVKGEAGSGSREREKEREREREREREKAYAMRSLFENVLGFEARKKVEQHMQHMDILQASAKTSDLSHNYSYSCSSPNEEGKSKEELDFKDKCHGGEMNEEAVVKRVLELELEISKGQGQQLRAKSILHNVVNLFEVLFRNWATYTCTDGAYSSAWNESRITTTSSNGTPSKEHGQIHDEKDEGKENDSGAVTVADDGDDGDAAADDDGDDEAVQNQRQKLRRTGTKHGASLSLDTLFNVVSDIELKQRKEEKEENASSSGAILSNNATAPGKSENCESGNANEKDISVPATTTTTITTTTTTNTELNGNKGGGGGGEEEEGKGEQQQQQQVLPTTTFLQFVRDNDANTDAQRNTESCSQSFLQSPGKLRSIEIPYEDMQEFLETLRYIVVSKLWDMECEVKGLSEHRGKLLAKFYDEYYFNVHQDAEIQNGLLLPRTSLQNKQDSEIGTAQLQQNGSFSVNEFGFPIDQEQNEGKNQEEERRMDDANVSGSATQTHHQPEHQVAIPLLGKKRNRSSSTVSLTSPPCYQGIFGWEGDEEEGITASAAYRNVASNEYCSTYTKEHENKQNYGEAAHPEERGNASGYDNNDMHPQKYIRVLSADSSTSTALQSQVIPNNLSHSSSSSSSSSSSASTSPSTLSTSKQDTRSSNSPGRDDSEDSGVENRSRSAPKFTSLRKESNGKTNDKTTNQRKKYRSKNESNYDTTISNSSLNQEPDFDKACDELISKVVNRPLESSAPCACKKSRCLKLYCDCFADGYFCQGCNCSSCQNLPDFTTERKRAMVAILRRRPGAFNSSISGSGSSASMPGIEVGNTVIPIKPPSATIAAATTTTTNATATATATSGATSGDAATPLHAAGPYKDDGFQRNGPSNRGSSDSNSNSKIPAGDAKGGGSQGKQDDSHSAQEKLFRTVKSAASAAAANRPACNCRRTKCMKKYCVCFNAGIYCGSWCNCLNCNNGTDKGGEARPHLGKAKAANGTTTSRSTSTSANGNTHADMSNKPAGDREKNTTGWQNKYPSWNGNRNETSGISLAKSSCMYLHQPTTTNPPAPRGTAMQYPSPEIRQHSSATYRNYGHLQPGFVHSSSYAPQKQMYMHPPMDQPQSISSWKRPATNSMNPMSQPSGGHTPSQYHPQHSQNSQNSQVSHNSQNSGNSAQSQSEEDAVASLALLAKSSGRKEKTRPV